MNRSSALSLATLALLAVACGGTPSRRTTTGTVDAGPADAGGSGCDSDSDCTAGTYCINSRCGSCRGARPLACPAGTICSSSGACTQRSTATTGSGSTGSAGSTGSGSTTGGTSGTVDACGSRTDCAGADACVKDLPDGGGQCSADSADSCSSNDDCVKGTICQAHACTAGCRSSLDCHGTANPVCISGNPGTCGPCTQSNQCQTGEACQGGQCVTQVACSDASACGHEGCVSGFCAPCTTDSQCGATGQCDADAGTCSAAPTCTLDATCQASHGGVQAWYCDATTETCKLGCTPDSACPGTAQCCNVSAGYSCSQTTHTCTPPATTGGTGTTGTTGVTTAGNNTSNTTGTTGGHGSTTGGTTTTTTTGGNTTGGGSAQICDSCSSDDDCVSGFCNTFTSEPAYCDTSATCTSNNVITQCGGVVTSCYQGSCDCYHQGSGTTGSSPGGACSACEDDSDCNSDYCNTEYGDPGFCDAPASCYLEDGTSDCDGQVQCLGDEITCACPQTGFTQGGNCSLCSRDSDCGPGLLCDQDNGYCYGACDDDSQCGGGVCDSFLTGSCYCDAF